MNQITFPRTSYDGTSVTQTDLETWYCGEIEADILTRLNAIDTTALGFFEKRILSWIKCSLHCILIASPKWLQRVSKMTDKYAKALFRYKDTKNKWQSTDFAKAVYEAFYYDGYRKNTLILLAEKLNVKSCPYCNMHYTLFAEDGKYYKDKLTKFQFDHFFDKADYPFLSMSLYNLIPSCGVCNQGKSTGHLSLQFHPYANSIADQFHFEVADPLSLFSGGKKDRIELSVVPDDATDAEVKEYNDMFHIHTLYRRHGDIAQEVFDTAYEEPYYLDTSSFQFLSSVASDYMLRLAYGTYINEYEIEKRPMTKYIQDLRKQAIDNKLAGVNLRKR